MRKKKKSTIETDIALLEAIKNNDRGAWEQLNKIATITIDTIIFKYGYGGLGEDHKKDLTQEIIIKISQKVLVSYNPEFGRLSTWIGQIARNHLYDEGRRMSRRNDKQIMEDIDESSVIYEYLLRNSDSSIDKNSPELRIIFNYLNIIDHKKWLVMYYFFFEAMPQKEMSGLLDLPEGTIKAYIHRMKLDMIAFMKVKSLPRSGRKYDDFQDAKASVARLKLKAEHDWYNYITKNDSPARIPRHPNYVYSEWVSWDDFLSV